MAQQYYVVLTRYTSKSSLALQFVENHFVENEHSPVEKKFTKTLNFKGKVYELEIIDTKNHESLAGSNQQHIEGTDGYIFVYSVTMNYSFKSVNSIRNSILKSMRSSEVDYIPAVVVGNKSDLHMQRQISSHQGSQLAKEIQALFIETSCKYNENAVTAFELLLTEIERYKNPPTQISRKSCNIS